MPRAVRLSADGADDAAVDEAVGGGEVVARYRGCSGVRRRRDMRLQRAGIRIMIGGEEGGGASAADARVTHPDGHGGCG